MDPSRNNPRYYTAYFEHEGNRFNVVVTSFSYSWSLAMKGRSYTRHASVSYPNRVQQSSLNVGLIFRTPDEYRRFGSFIDAYHRRVTNMSKPADMRFVCNRMGGLNKWSDERGVRYGVAIQKVPMKFTHDMVAPTLSLTLDILTDEFDIWEPPTSSMTGDSSGSLVSGQDIIDSGNIAFLSPKN